MSGRSNACKRKADTSLRLPPGPSLPCGALTRPAAWAKPRSPMDGSACRCFLWSQGAKPPGAARSVCSNLRRERHPALVATLPAGQYWHADRSAQRLLGARCRSSPWGLDSLEPMPESARASALVEQFLDLLAGEPALCLQTLLGELQATLPAYSPLAGPAAGLVRLARGQTRAHVIDRISKLSNEVQQHAAHADWPEKRLRDLDCGCLRWRAPSCTPRKRSSGRSCSPRSPTSAPRAVDRNRREPRQRLVLA